MSEDNPTLPETPPTVETGAPVLPLRDVVVYPHMVIPLFVGRERSVKALNHAMQGGKQIVLVAQKQAEVDEPGLADMYEVGTLATILQLLNPAQQAAPVVARDGEELVTTRSSGAAGFIAEQAARGCDLLVAGVSPSWGLEPSLFGQQEEVLARLETVSLLVIRKRR